MATRPDLYLPLTGASGQPEDAGMDDDPDRTIIRRVGVQTVPVGTALPEDVDRASPDAWPTIGHVGRYALKSCVGEGGLGTVYAAHDPLLGRWLAIKTLHVALPSEDRERFNAIFLNEAKAAGGLNHPHIVTVFDVAAGETDTYIAMELLRGKDLRHVLASGLRPSIAETALIMRRVADALSYAHHHGVIHRDIKPANIFMVGRTHPKVLDFGIARIRLAEASANDGVSRFSDVVAGSPYYMAPEQVRHDPVDRRADVYAMGVVMYELLTGQKPFTGQDLDAILTGVLTQEVVPPHVVDANVPEALSAIVMRAMARDVSARTRSARLLSQELRVWLDGQAAAPGTDVLAQPAADLVKPTNKPTKALTVEAPKKKYKRVAAAALVATAVVGAVGAWMAWSTTQQATPVVAMSNVAAPPKAAVPTHQAAIAAPEMPAQASASASVPASMPLVALPVPVTVTAPVALAPSTTASAAVVTAQPPVLDKQTAPVVAAVLATPAVPKAVRATGTLRMAISPWGRVSVDGKSMGVAPPLTRLTLSVGKHTVTVQNDDSPAHTQTIQVEAGQTVQITHSF